MGGAVLTESREVFERGAARFANGLPVLFVDDAVLEQPRRELSLKATEAATEHLCVLFFKNFITIADGYPLVAGACFRCPLPCSACALTHQRGYTPKATYYYAQNVDEICHPLSQTNDHRALLT